MKILFPSMLPIAEAGWKRGYKVAAEPDNWKVLDAKDRKRACRMSINVLINVCFCCLSGFDGSL